MLRVGDFNLSSTPEYPNSPQEDLKQTMIGQEVIFRQQVYELHRIYQIQKVMMGDSGCTELDAYNFWKSPGGPFTNQNQYAAANKGNMFGKLMEGSTESFNNHFLETSCLNSCRIQQGTACFSLPNDQHSNLADKDCFGKGKDQDWRENIQQIHNWFFDSKVNAVEEIDLTLRIGEERKKKARGKEACYDKSAHFFSHHVIDLDASTEIVPQEKTKLASTLISYATSISGIQSTDLSHGLTATSSIYGGKRCKEENSVNRGGDEPKSGIVLDLNEIQFDDSFNLNDSMDTCPRMEGPFGPFDRINGICFEGSSSTAECCGVLNVNRLNEPSFILRKDDDFSGKSAEICIAEKTVALERNATFLHPCQNITRSDDSNNDIICFKNESSSGSKSTQPGTNCDQIPEFRSLQVEENQSVEKMNEGLTQGDALMKKAAELLLHLSSEHSIINQDYSTTDAGLTQIENEGKDQTQCSVDSYELLVLKLSETSVDDDYCVSSKSFEVDESEKRDYEAKWKRGRRLKDFQKEILPNLVSLTRHEIREDIGIMQAVMRSREYKRMRSKSANGECWFTPTKSKRPRPRRRYS